MNNKSELASSGVEALIEQLREQGVKNGQKEASKLIEEAEHRSDWLLEQARLEAEQILVKARREAAHLKNAGEDALKIAARDLHLEVKESLAHSFAGQVERLVAHQMDNGAFMQKLILELVGKVREEMALDKAAHVEVLLPRDFIGLEELRRSPHEYKEGQLSHFVQSLTAEQLREGVEIAFYEGRGIKVRLSSQKVEVDLSEDAVSRLLLKHLQPRFRAIVEGVIR
ncbi:ATPase [Neptunomonas japonica]|uniref:V-type H+-transporting ATPase subunit E n=1 Tax=Neptunomonas japonica JAMM 1380 TaxID=1441457 RepID=A0A7R6SUE7_9GAMM|nr:ATPase [Neptunomonas japonica]BBB28424.1 V-type H+-transporting ATPase subunit E [Neptunomonas japonica JAMM 1380]